MSCTPWRLEDVLTTQRPKLDDYPGSGDHPGRLFLVVRTIEQVGHHLVGKQISLFLGRNTLLTFEESAQEPASAILGPVRQRIETPGSRLRNNDVSFLLYSLLHAAVDAFFPLLEESAETASRSWKDAC